MRRIIPAAVAAIAGTLTLAACTGGPALGQPGESSFSPGPTLSFSPSVAPSASPIPTAAPPIPARGPAVSQAGAAYLRIADPVNRAADAVNTDLVYGVPFALLRTDDLAYIAALRKSVTQFRAIHWPARVQGYVSAMLLTYDPASIACAQAVASAGSNAVATYVLSTNPSCAESQNASDPQQIRMLLHLPSMAGYIPWI